MLALTLMQSGGAAGGGPGEFVRPRPIESAWPSSLLPYVSLVVALVALWKVWRDSQAANVAPVKQQIVEVKEWAAEEIRRMEQHFDHAMEEQSAHQDQGLNGLRESLTGQINGYGRRVEEVEGFVKIQNGINDVLLEHRAESREDRRNLNNRLDKMDANMNRILDALVQLRGGRR